MPTPPDFTNGTPLDASSLNSIGLWLVKSQAVQVSPAVSSVVVTNAFSADFDNYRITYEGATGLATGECLRLQLGSTTTGYYGNLVYANYSNGAPASVGDNNTANWTHCSGANNSRTSLVLDITNPFRSVTTHIFSAIYADSGNAGSKRGYLANNTSYTGFTIIVGNALTISGGTIRVYGYNT